MANKLAAISDVAGSTFDYIVIGGGTAGCVVASRLSEDPNVSVVVLEAGPPHIDDPVNDEPSAFLKPILDPEYDHRYTTTPQPGFDGQPTMFPRGRGLGGTSQINWMIWTVPQREEIEGIGRLGNEGWTWENFHKYQKKVQRFYPPPDEELVEYKSLFNSTSLGHDGPVPLMFSRHSSGAEALWQKSLGKYGVEVLSDGGLNGQTSGTYKSISNVDPATGKRAYSATTYLLPALDRPNLKVLTNASVRKILTNPGSEGVTASGVEFECDGRVYTVHSRKEAVLSAGAVKSPQILELSGIGDRKILEPLGIEVKVDLPAVGTNVQEHVSMGYNRWKIKEDQNIVTSGMLEDPAQAAKLRDALGLSDTIQMVISCVSFVPIQQASDRADALVRRQKEKLARDADSLPLGLREQHEVQLQLLENPHVPDFEILFFPFMIHIFPNPEPSKPYLNMFPTLARPFSRGTIHITSSNPHESPAIDPRYFSEQIDLDILVDGVKFIRRVAQTAPFAAIVEREELPGPDVQTDEQLYEYVRKNASSSWHTCGSNSMLPRDKGGVVDSKFKVYGTQNIRVVDLSVLPLHTAVHPQATVYTLAEMASDIIRANS
ncbi:GMC oxidoreductase [Phanerochaete sordida]|uniref:GMC oxidoreductase n=1 Tax=Phanerochaete sordida TaxID=48140 RepID=A0A9P3LFI0_9APHY|nr:GMC oxidoreductase [Phanerochaete sordida]